MKNYGNCTSIKNATEYVLINHDNGDVTFFSDYANAEKAKIAAERPKSMFNHIESATIKTRYEYLNS